MVRPHLVACATLCAALAGGGCGLIDSDITDFDLSLPNKTYTLDTQSWNLMGDPSAVLRQSCASNMGICQAMAMQVCTTGQCRGECNAVMTCDLVIPVHPFTTINLAEEKEELATINEQALVDVQVDTISYAITENTLNRLTPPLRFYVAPESVMTPEDTQAVVIGTIQPVPPMTTVPMMEMAMTPAGHARLVQAMQDFRTPFNVMIATDIVLTNGDSIPTGRLTTNMTIEAHAGI